MYFDLFFDDEPDREEGNDTESIYAIAKVSFDGDVFFHCHVTKDQYLSMIAEDPKLAKSISKMNKKVLKSIEKLDKSVDECPVHVFGDSVIDVDAKKKYNVNAQNNDITQEQVNEMIFVEHVEVENGEQ